MVRSEERRYEATEEGDGSIRCDVRNYIPRIIVSITIEIHVLDMRMNSYLG